MCVSYAVIRSFCRQNRFPTAESEFVSLFEIATRSERGSDTDARLKVARGVTSNPSRANAASRGATERQRRADLPRAGGLMPPWPT